MTILYFNKRTPAGSVPSCLDPLSVTPNNFSSYPADNMSNMEQLNYLFNCFGTRATESSREQDLNFSFEKMKLDGSSPIGGMPTYSHPFQNALQVRIANTCIFICGPLKLHRCRFFYFLDSGQHKQSAAARPEQKQKLKLFHGGCLCSDKIRLYQDEEPLQSQPPGETNATDSDDSRITESAEYGRSNECSQCQITRFVYALHRVPSSPAKRWLAARETNVCSFVVSEQPR